MGRIRILSDEVANKIAAGEVVERPASVVKELLENSLDAGASELRVEVSGGGRRLVRVADNGCGMLCDDAMLAFERHATSKLSGVKDLLSIATLGFRGEALPSIASVSRLVLETRAAEELTGTRVEVAGAKMLRASEAALAPGTQVTVRDLFYNVPARKKFLRSEQTELAHIASLVTHYSLAHPEKTFLLRSDAKELLNVTPVEKLRDRVYQVFGSRILEELVDLGVRERQLELPAPRGRQQDLPAARVHLAAPGAEDQPQLDLPVCEPATDPGPPAAARHFFGLSQPDPAGLFPVCAAVSGMRLRRGGRERPSLQDRSAVPAPVFRARFCAGRDPGSADRVPAGLGDSSASPGAAGGRAAVLGVFAADRKPELGRAAVRNRLPGGERGSGRAAGIHPARARPPAARLDFGEGAIPVSEPAPLKLPVPDTHGGFPAEDFPEPSQSLSALADLRTLGQLQDSFIVAAGRDGLWIVDQHVAHERILFEQILKQRAAGRVQMQRLLMPLIVQLTPAQEIEYSRIAEELGAIGFETEPFGHRTVAVKAAPAGISAADLEKLIFEILEIAERELRKTSLEDLRRGIAASIACHAAIKVNMRLEQGKMEWLLRSLAATECPMSCPHGRPIALRYSLRDILKGFHRI